MTVSDIMGILSRAEAFRPATLTKGKVWFISWYQADQTGVLKRVRRKVNHIRCPKARRQWADLRVKEINARLLLGLPADQAKVVPRGETPLQEALDRFLATKTKDELRKDSMRSYRSYCGILSDWLATQERLQAPVASFGEEDARAFLEHCYLYRRISARTWNNYLAFFGTLAGWLVEHKYLPRNVFAGIHRKKAPKGKNRRPLTDAERRMVRADLEANDPRFLVFSLLLFHCALRPKEAFMLRPEHYDLERQCINVPPEVAKNGEARAAAIPNVLVDLVRGLGIQEQDPAHYVFSEDFAPGAKLMTSQYSGKAWDRLRTRLGLPMEVKHYSLRDTGLIQLARDGVSRVDSQNHFDHSSAAMQDIYSRLGQAEGNAAVKVKATAF